MSRIRTSAPPLLTAALLVIGIYEFARNPNLHHLPWTGLGLWRLAFYAVAFAAIAAFRRPALLLAAGLIYGMAAIGPGPFAACGLFCCGATAAGSLLLGDSLGGEPVEIPICLCLGEGLIGIAASVLGWTHLCYPLTFLLLVLTPIFARRRWLAGRAKLLVLPGGSPGVWLLAFAVGIEYLLTLKPEVGTDSLAMHLALPAYVAMHHHFSYDVREFLWAAMPQTADWCYATAYAIGGEFAARLLNFSNLLASLGLLYGFTSRYCSRTAALLTCALYATGPLVQVTTGSLFIDNLAAALLMACVVSFCRHEAEAKPRVFAAGAVLLGLALSVKSGSAAFLPGILALALFGAIRNPPGWRVVTASATGALAIALYYYSIAWRQTGNPFFPYANEIFRSKLIDTVQVAGQFREPLSWRTPVDLTFHSGRYIEGSDGAAGFQYFLLLPPALLTLIRRRPCAMLWTAAIGLSALVLTFAEISYLRYLYPALLLLMAPIAVWLHDQQAGRWRTAFALGAVAVAGTANVLYQSSAGWYHRDFVWNEIWHPDERERYVRENAPARIIIDVLNRLAPGEPALFCQFDHIAGFSGIAYTTNWHTYLRHEGLENFREAIEVLGYLNERKIQYIASPVSADLDTWPRVLPAFFDDFAEPVFEPGRWVLYRVRREFAGPSGMEAARKWMSNPPPAGKGQWDDIDVRVIRTGDWFRDFAASEALYHTLTRSRSKGATLTIPFRGTRISLLYARDPSSGVAEVLVDGERRALIDEYAPAPVFRVEALIGGLAEGVHSLTIRVTGSRNPAAQDCLVNLDGFAL
ncbi:MAG TPA: glycosyltransferase family 39 protein [Bryobacteraceae bacterium]|nr:glycosyltransferase family 39 protein [Bryobacteraceae bacterium]